MQPSNPKNRFEDTYGQVSPLKPQQGQDRFSNQTSFSAHEKKQSQQPTRKNHLFQLGVTLILILSGAAALIIGGLFAVASLTIGLFLFLFKRLFLGSSGSSGITPRR